MKQNKKRYRNIVLFLTFISVSVFGIQTTYAQNTVTGTITAEDGPLPGVSVLVKGTTIGTVADFDGNYSIDVPANGTTLVFSYLGYAKQEAEINGRSTINIILQEDAQALSEVVVVGYGTQRKADLTGSVASIGADEIVSKPITSPDQALAGTMAGVNINNRSGDPGAPISVFIRGVGTPGVNDPLWVIDGVPIVQTTNITVNTSSTTDSNPLAGLNANDIKSIDVLKDAASTAIYGARAANGVIIVTTKRGSGKGKVTYDGYVSQSSARDLIDVLNVEQYIDIQGQLGRDVSQFSGQPFVDWQDLIFKKGFVQNHNVSVAGGSENGNYFISGGYMGQEGIERAQEFTRYSFKANSDIKFGKWKFGESLLISQTDRLIQSEEGIYAGFNSASNAPYYQPFGDGALGYNQLNQATLGDGNASNWLFNTDERVVFTTVQNRKVLGNFYGELEVAKNLKARASLGMDYNVGDGIYSLSKYVLNNSTGNSRLISEKPIELTLTSAATLSYDTTFGDGDHNISALFGFEQTKFRYDKVRVQGENPFIPIFPATGTPPVGSSNEADIWTLQGWLGRLNYNYQGKYLATVNVRRDATSRFAENNRAAIFPSLSLGWRISQEDFFPKESVVEDLKLRASWGKSGNQFTGLNFAYLSLIDNNIRYVIGEDQNTILAPAPTTFANRDLVWETSTQTDIGLDATLLDSKLSVTLDYYNKKTTDVLLGFPLPYVSGFFLPADSNIGDIVNSGIEFSLNYSDKIGDFNYGIGANFTTNHNEVLDLGEVGAFTSGTGGGVTHRTAEGYSLGYFYGYKTDGLYQNDAEVAAAVPDSNGTPSPGDIRFVDVNEDGVVNSEDRTYLGSPFPKFFYGLSLTGEYKGFDLSINLRGVGNQQVYNTARQSLESLQGGNNFSTQVFDRWTGEGTANSSSNPRLTEDDPNDNNRYSDRWIEDAGYLRIQNIQIGYNIPQERLISWTNDFVSSMRFYIGAQNLATFTKYSGYDPEVGRNQSFQKGNTNVSTGVDGGASPLPRIIQFGWTVSFN